MKTEELLQKLEKHRNSTNTTHRELAEAIGVTEETISRWLNDHTVPTSRPIIEAIKRYLSKNKG